MKHSPSNQMWKIDVSIDKGGHLFIMHDNYLLLPPVYEVIGFPLLPSILMKESAIQLIDHNRIAYDQLAILPNGKRAYPTKECITVGVMRFDPDEIPVLQAIAHDAKNVELVFSENKDILSEKERFDLKTHYLCLSILKNIEERGRGFQPTQTLRKSGLVEDYKMDEDHLYWDIRFKSRCIRPTY